MTDGTSQSLGKGMLFAAWVIILIGLVALFGSWEDAQQNPNIPLSENGDGPVVLRANRQHHYVAPGRINEHPVTFFLDTGATDVVIPAQLADKIGLQPGFRRQAQTANGVVEVRDTRIDSLRIGHITLFDIRASINPAMQGNEVLLGMSALKNLEFSQSGDTLSLRVR